MLSFFRRKSVENENIAKNASNTDTTKTNTTPEQEATVALPKSKSNLLSQYGYGSSDELKETIYDILRTIRDPEKPSTLEDLNVVSEGGIFVQEPTNDNVNVVRVEFNPTVPHCSLATLIGLCIRVKIERNIPHKLKLDIYIKKGTHTTEDEINKQINDKERIAAAMENPNLKDLVENCIQEDE